MSLLLQIETATTSCSVALAKDGVVLGFKQINQRNIHAEVITLFVEELLVSAGLKYDELDAIAVSSGPGSYTGLRIGISTAKGLCFALDKPLIAIETLEAMVYGIINADQSAISADTLLCPMIDARRMEVFTAVFSAGGTKIKPTAAEIIDANSFADLLEINKILFFGDGAEKCREVLGAHRNASFLPDFVNSAVHLTQKALEKFRNKEFEDVAYFEPYYLKDFIAGKKAV
ncbi:tRNA (adenosine(37)-N6)-threonylcarbamoyltransferase complex dimerization subunit type 1 TsaB [Mucilaginibacter gotjawali]|uniref:tRNA threonylcarbamoyladenosine biosynthesis protein TsaB n=2 Tax=Mucilaginibacter gotjawali TaxID=1550579 RepID=A0A839S6Y9_9SPHI|nr:tRNA (adenosine(37)-N6)-threonylcarbamoyltransferase complex dimerization subunit type 1 TsaB [Mucilaginibacter gotjawali]MBB3053645.1 tRNA threonylcarbamoyladenosine biosynthesis protein TsaB [Mucilaginibacter gotjawali]BAU53904.1 tRNA threonylcarbamoyladenosine biosynthesis protein TsaB [Mucilaginibacter gotjawali]